MVSVAQEMHGLKATFGGIKKKPKQFWVGQTCTKQDESVVGRIRISNQRKLIITLTIQATKDLY